MITGITIRNNTIFDDSTKITGLNKINVFFGTNGSGKTTISRIIANATHCGDSEIDWANNTPLDTRVYNRDFIERNFSQPDTSTVKGVFTLGENQKVTLQKIEEIKRKIEELDNDLAERNTTLNGKGERKGKIGEADALEKKYGEKFWGEIKKANEDKFKGAMEGHIKSIPSFMKKLLMESENTTASLRPLSELEESAAIVFNTELREIERITIPDYSALLTHEQNAILRKLIVGKESIDIAAIIQTLGNSDWVQQGISFYRKNDGVCPFCQQKTHDSLKKSLDEYFDETFQRDTKEIFLLLSAYEKDSEEFKRSIQMLIETNAQCINMEGLRQMKTNLDALVSANINTIRRKQKEPSVAANLASLEKVVKPIVALLEEANEHIDKQNDIIRNRRTKHAELTAQIWRYFVEISKDDVSEYKEQKSDLEKAITSIRTQIDAKMREKDERNRELKALEKETTSIEPTLRDINRLLSSFGFQSFMLTEADEGNAYKLVRQDGTEVKQTLSEGEKNFLAFLYFYHLLRGSHNETGMLSNKVVVFDDPICSLDNDALFIVSTLIRSLYDDIENNQGNIKQVFIMTHNVYFHKEVTFNVKNGYTTFWLIKKNGMKSTIEVRGKNPISTAYELLWNEVKDDNRNKITIQNTLRRILEHYFKILGGIKYDELINKFEDEDKTKCKALISWVNDGSHSVFGDEFYTPLEDVAIKRYLEVFKEIFDKAGHIAHYNMMMEIS